MLRHGTSHGLAIITCTLTSGILIGIVKDTYPTLHRIVLRHCTDFVNSMGFTVSGKHLATILLAGILALIWGAAFSMMHED